MEGIKKAMNERNLNEGQWEDMKQWSPVVRQHRKIVLNPIYTYIRTRVGTLIVATIYLQLIQNRYMFRSFTVLHCSHQHCVQPIAIDVEVVGYL